MALACMYANMDFLEAVFYPSSLLVINRLKSANQGKEGSNMVKNIAAIAAGVLTWWVVFIGGAIVMSQFWPAFKLAIKAFPDTESFNAAMPMQVSMLILFVFCGVVAGWLTVLISKQRIHACYVAGLLMMYIAPNHLYFSWDMFAPWYNWLVVLPVIPLVVGSGRLVKVRSVQ